MESVDAEICRRRYKHSSRIIRAIAQRVKYVPYIACKPSTISSMNGHHPRSVIIQKQSLLAFPIKRCFSNLATLFQKKLFFKACWCTLFFQKVFLFFRDCPFGFGNYCPEFQEKFFFKACWCTLFFQKVFLFFRDCPFGFGNYCPEFQEKLFFKACWCTLFFSKSISLFQRLPFWFWKLLLKF